MSVKSSDIESLKVFNLKDSNKSLKKDLIKIDDPLESISSKMNSVFSKNLQFDYIKKFTFSIFISESFMYILTFFAQKFLSILIHALLGIFGQYKLIGKISFTIITLDVFSSGLRDFQIPVGIICGPLYSKGDFFNYKLQRNKLILINSGLYLIFMSVWFVLTPIYNLIGVLPENLNDIMFLSKWYILVYGPLMAITNFLKGFFYFSLII